MYAQASNLLLDVEELGDQGTSHMGKYEPRKW